MCNIIALCYLDESIEDCNFTLSNDTVDCSAMLGGEATATEVNVVTTSEGLQGIITELSALKLGQPIYYNHYVHYFYYSEYILKSKRELDIARRQNSRNRS